MFSYFGHLIEVLVLGILCSTKIVSGRFCEGGHICSLPRECCTQGCCPPYQSGPRQLPPASDHVLNLFFISHWYFWCVVVAIILAILCAYSLWKKRRTLCGWGFSEHHTQSEGDSAGSCYAPPQYSRCNSFHHPPPPYTETWRDLKSRTSVMARERRKEMAKTGGNPLTLPALTDLQLRVLEILGQNYAEGSSICPESFPEEEHLQILLECGDSDVLYQCPTIANVAAIEETCEAAGGEEENWPVDTLEETVEEPAVNQTSRAVPKRKRVPKRTEMNLARDQFATIAKKQAEAITVTSKPDLYPLVFTCNSDNGKNGSSYLMVQYFRNYIVRPTGSLSATSTVDSLSSSFICNANEANTLVPPPYSRATSPEIGGFSSHLQQHYMIPRSASQLVCANGNHDILSGNIASQNVYQTRSSPYNNARALNSAAGGQEQRDLSITPYGHNSQLRMVESGVDSRDSGNSETIFQAESDNNANRQTVAQRTNGFVQSQSDQHFRYIANSNSSISDIFVNNSCSADLCDTSAVGSTTRNNEQAAQATTPLSQQFSIAGGTPAIYSNGCIQTNPLVHKVASNPKHSVEMSSRNTVYNSNSSIGGISITVPAITDGGEEFRDLDVLRRSLETCCQFLQQHQMPTAASFASGDSPLRMHDFVKKYGDEGLRSYMTSGSCSAVSSLANIGTPSSPPQATSPTGEIKDILDQIRQLQTGGASIEEALLKPRPHLQHTVSSPSPSHQNKQFPADNQQHQLQRFPTMPERPSVGATSPTSLKRSAHNPSASKAAASSATITLNSQHPTSSLLVTKRPSTLQQNKKKFFTPKPNKALYIPMMANPTPPPLNRCHLKSPVNSVVGANFFNNRARVRKGWISRSAPTTPGTGLPPNRLGDDSPLLNEHDEDQETEQNYD